jgi:hypothetical protein
VQAFLHEEPCLPQQLAGQQHGGGGAVAGFRILRLGHLDDHLGRRVLNVHLPQYGSPVIGDDDVARRVYQHLVHASRPERRSDRAGHGHGCHDIVSLSLTPAGDLATLAHDVLLSCLFCHDNPPV